MYGQLIWELGKGIEMRTIGALLCLSASVCLLALGCEEPEPETNPSLTSGARVSTVTTASGAAVRINGAGGKTVIMKIYNAAGQLIATRPQAIPPGHWFQFQPKLLPGQYIINIEIAGALYGSCKYLVLP